MPTFFLIALATALLPSAPAPSQQAFVDTLAEFQAHHHRILDAERAIHPMLCGPDDPEPLRRACAELHRRIGMLVIALEVLDELAIRAVPQELGARPHDDANAPPRMRVLHQELREAILFVDVESIRVRIPDLDCMSLIEDARPALSRDLAAMYRRADERDALAIRAGEAEDRLHLHVAPRDEPKSRE